MGELSELLSRVEQASGPGRELDEAIMALFYTREERHIGATEGWEDEPESFKPVKSRVWVDPTTDKWVSTAAYDFTASIDAALALVGRMLPDHRWGVHCHHSSRGEFRAHVTKQSPLRPMPNIADAPTAPLAIVAATLRALISEPSNG